MRISTITTTIVAILVGALIAAVAPAAAQNDLSGAPDQAASPAQRADHDKIVLRRDGDKAVPFEPVVSDTVNDPQAGLDSSSGFDWGFAVIAGGSVLGLMLLAVGALLPIRRSRPDLRQRTLH